jgi:hypothetical protein
MLFKQASFSPKGKTHLKLLCFPFFLLTGKKKVANAKDGLSVFSPL